MSFDLCSRVCIHSINFAMLISTSFYVPAKRISAEKWQINSLMILQISEDMNIQSVILKRENKAEAQINNIVELKLK